MKTYQITISGSPSCPPQIKFVVAPTEEAAAFFARSLSKSAVVTEPEMQFGCDVHWIINASSEVIRETEEGRIFRSLPERCLALLPSDETVILVVRGEKGYSPTTYDKQSKEWLDHINRERCNCSPAQAEAMLIGSMFGWDVPGADPSMYDEKGCPVR